MVSTTLSCGVATGVPATTGFLVSTATACWLAASQRDRDTAPSCSSTVAARRIQWVNTPVLIEAMERHRQGLLPRSMQLWLQQLLELPPDSSPPELPGGPHR